MITADNWEVADDITHIELSFLFETPIILMYFQYAQYE